MVENPWSIVVEAADKNMLLAVATGLGLPVGLFL
jgi:hypothetical protein